MLPKKFRDAATIAASVDGVLSDSANQYSAQSDVRGDVDWKGPPRKSSRVLEKYLRRR